MMSSLPSDAAAPVMPPAPRALWRLPRVTGGVFADLALWMIGLGLLAGAVFPVFVLALGVAAEQALTVEFYAATLAAGLLVGGVNYLLARAVVGVRLRLLGQRTGFVGEMVTYATSTGDWSRCDPEQCVIPVDSDDELGECARAFNRLIAALGHSHAVEAAVRDLFEALSSHLELDALSDTALQRLLAHADGRGGAVVVDIERQLRVTAARDLPHVGQLTEEPDVLAALRERRTRLVRVGGLELLVTPIEFERRALGCVVLDVAGGGEAERLTALFARAFGVALNNALTHAHAQRLAESDPLTGAANRRAGLQILQREIERARADRHALGVLMLDLDHFKAVNDRHGHLAGDRVLAAAAGGMRAALREHDTLVRYGGEEFLIVLPGADPTGARRAADRARHAVAAATAAADLPVTASVGWATLAGAERVDELLDRADRALYEAKAAGRDRVAPAQP